LHDFLSPEQNQDPNFYEDDLSNFDNINNQVEDLPIQEEHQELLSDQKFDANLALDLSESQLQTLASDLIDEIKQDKQARSEWENSINLAFRYLGFKIEEGKQEPFINACAAIDGTLAQALITTYSVFRAELFPSSGPCSGKVIGVETKEKQDRAERVELYTNTYLTKMDRGYYPDSEQLIIYTIFCGSAFRKVYPDPLDGKPMARMIKPQNFIVNPDTVDLMSAPRMTHELFYTRKEVLDLEHSEFYKEGSLPPEDDTSSDDEETSSISRTIDRMDGLEKNSETKKLVVRYYECFVELDPALVEMGIHAPPEDAKENYRPYIVTICAENKKIAAIRRGWVQNSNTFEKAIYFVSYYYIKGFGIYGLGLAHLMGSNSIVLTSILRQLIDAGSLKNFPAFLYSSGARLENNDFALGPGEGKEVDTVGLPIDQVITRLPYAEPSAALMQLRNELIQSQNQIGSAANTQLPEIGPNAPVGTTVALLEANNRVLSTVLRSFHFSLSHEFELLYKLFGNYLQDVPYPFSVPGKDTAVMRSDFDDYTNITPVSDPNMLMRSHRLVQADVLMNLAEKHPELHNMREIYVRIYSTMNVENIDGILPPPEKPKALDAISENMNIMAGKGVIAALDQDHDSHIFQHMNLASQLMQMQNIAAYVISMSHIQVHKALKLIVNIPQLQQMLLPSMQQWSEDPHILLTIPQIQRMIDQKDYEEEAEKQRKAQEEMANQQKPLDPTVVMLEEVKVKQESNHLRAEETKLKTETELRVNEIKAETEREKMVLQKILQEEKQKFDLLVEKMKLDERLAKYQHKAGEI
jgi:hypothetical protein